MHARFWLWIALAAACPSAFAADPSFAELLAKAEAQYAAGHRWAPPGDNMVETVAGMMDKISTATPQQLAELSALLEKGAVRPPDLTKSEPAAPAPPVTPLEVAPPPVAPPPTGLAKSEPAAPAPPVTPLQVAPLPVAPPPMGLAKSEPAAPAPPVASPPVAPPQVVPPPGAPPKPSPQAGARAADLLARGRQAEDLGNVSGARRFYASAAALGNGVAALALGRLYDPAYLKQSALGGIEPDTNLARYWYQRAAALGDPEAGRLLQALSER